MKLPDGPLADDFWSQRSANPLQTLENCVRLYGDTFTVRSQAVPGLSQTSPPKVIFSHPQDVEEIFTADPSLFNTGKNNVNLQPLVGEHSLVLLDGIHHRRQRQLLMPPFHGERMRAYGQIICDITEQVTQDWKVNQTIYIRPLMQEITLRIILCAVFGLQQEGLRFRQLRQLLASLLDSLNLNWQSILQLREKIDKLIYAEIRERREQSDLSGTDILTLMMSVRDEEGQAMTDIELRDELITLLMAGHETTSTALSWAMYWIHQTPGVLKKLLDELNTLDFKLNPNKISRLSYLTAICQETLRIYPVTVFSFSRVVKTPLKIAGYKFDPGTILSPCAYLTHHREELYSEPKRFKPERFLERQYSLYEYYPFGGGNRLCIGMAFAQYEMKLILASILNRFKLAFPLGYQVNPVQYGIAISPPKDMYVQVKDFCTKKSQAG